MSLKLVAIKSMLWNAVDHGSTTVISFLSLIIFAKLLEPRDFGVYSMAFAIIEIASILPSNLFYEALVRYDRATDEHFDAAFTVSLLLSALTLALVWFILPYFQPIVADSRVVNIGRALALALIVSGPVSIFTARQSREFGFRILAQRTLVGRLAGAALGIVAAFLHFGVWALVIQYLAVTFLGSIALVLFSAWKPRLTAAWHPAGELVGYGVGAVIALSATFVTKRAFAFSVGVYLGTEKAGLLNLAFRMFDTVWAISAAAISEVVLPLMAKMQGDQKRTLKAYRTTTVLGCFLLYPAFAGLGVVSPELIHLIFGEKWLLAAQPSLWLGLLIFVQAPRIFQSSLLKATGNIGYVRSTNLTALGFMALGIVVTQFKTESIALAVWAGVEALNFALLTFFTQTRVKFLATEQLRLMTLPLLAAGVMCLAVIVARQNMVVTSLPVRLLFLCGVGTITYFAIALAFGKHSLLRMLREFRAGAPG